jgi:hypothetical protein
VGVNGSEKAIKSIASAEKLADPFHKVFLSGQPAFVLVRVRWEGGGRRVWAERS